MKELLILNSINKDDWDARKGKPKQKKEELIKLSILLDAIKTKLLGIYLDLTLNDQELSAEKIKSIFLGNENPDVSKKRCVPLGKQFQIGFTFHRHPQCRQCWRFFFANLSMVSM